MPTRMALALLVPAALAAPTNSLIPHNMSTHDQVTEAYVSEAGCNPICKINRLTRDVADLSNDLSDANSMISDLTGQVSSLQSEVASMTSSINIVTPALSSWGCVLDANLVNCMTENAPQMVMEFAAEHNPLLEALNDITEALPFE